MNAHCHGLLCRAILRLYPEFMISSTLAKALAAEADVEMHLEAPGPFPDYNGPLLEGAARFPDMIATRGRRLSSFSGT